MTVDVWERQVMPQGRVAVPGGNAMAEQFGHSLAGASQAINGAASDIVRADRIAEERDWQAEQPKVAKAVAQSAIDSQQDIANIKAGLPADLSGYQEAVGKYWDAKQGELSKVFTSPRAQEYLGLQMISMKGSDVAAAVRDSTAATIKVRGDNVQSVLDLGANTLASRPDQYASTMTNVFATIDAQKGLVPEATLDEWRTQATQNLTASMISGQIERNAPQALKLLNSGQYDGSLEPTRKAQMVNQAQAVIKADAARAESARREQQAITASATAAKVSDYNTSVRNNGGVPPTVNGKPLVTKEQVLSAFADDPTRAQYLVQQMETNEQIGHLSSVVKSNTMEQDQALVGQYSPKPGQMFTGDDAEKLKAVTSFVDAKWKAAQEGVAADLKDFQNGQQEDVARNIKDWNQTAFAKGIPDDAQAKIYSAYGNTAQADEVYGKLKQSEALGNLQRQAVAGNIDVTSDLYKQATTAAAAGGTGSAYAEDQAELLKRVLDDKVTALRDSPAAYVVGTQGPLKEKWDTFAKLQQEAQAKPGDVTAQNAAAAAGKAAADATIAAQISTGYVADYQAQAIPQPLAKQYAFNIQNADPEKRPAIAQEIMNLGPAALGQVIKEGAPPSIAAYAAVTDDPVWTAQLSAAEKLTGTDVAGILKTRDVKRSDLDDRVTSAFADLAGTIPGSSQSAYRDSITSVAVMNVARGMSTGDAVKAAMAPFTRGSTVSGSLRIPSEYPQPDVDKGLRSVMTGIASGTVPVKVIPSGLPGATTESDLQAIKDAARTGGLHWMTNENSTGAILTLPTGRYLETPEGKRFEVLFPDALAKGRAQPKASIGQMWESAPPAGIQVPGAAAGLAGKTVEPTVILDYRMQEEGETAKRARIDAPKQPQRDDVAEAVKKFPALAKVAGNVVVEDHFDDPNTSGQLESYPPWEGYNPHPGKFTSQIYNKDAKGDERTSLVAGDMLHYLGAVDPGTGKAVDPPYRAMKEKLLNSFTPEQTKNAKARFAREKAGGNYDPSVTYEQWLDISHGDEFIMGYITPDKADEWRKVYTPEQKKILNKMKAYLKQDPFGSGDVPWMKEDPK